MCAKEGVGGGKGILFFVDMQCPWKPLPSHAQFLTPPYALLHPSFTYEREAVLVRQEQGRKRTDLPLDSYPGSERGPQGQRHRDFLNFLIR